MNYDLKLFRKLYEQGRGMNVELGDDVTFFLNVVHHLLEGNWVMMLLIMGKDWVSFIFLDFLHQLMFLILVM